MSDNLSKKGRQDRLKINTGQNYEMRYWSEKWGVSYLQIFDAFVATGRAEVRIIEDYLRQQGAIKGD